MTLPGVDFQSFFLFVVWRGSTGSERRDDDIIYHNGVSQGSEEFFSTISEPR